MVQDTVRNSNDALKLQYVSYVVRMFSLSMSMSTYMFTYIRIHYISFQLSIWTSVGDVPHRGREEYESSGKYCLQRVVERTCQSQEALELLSLSFCLCHDFHCNLIKWKGEVSAQHYS